MLVIASFISFNAWVCSSPQHLFLLAHVTVWLNLRGVEETCLDIVLGPITAALLVGLGISLMALIVLRSTLGPSPVPTWPMNPTSVCLRLSFSMFSLSPRSLHRCRNEVRVVSWSLAAFSIVST